MIVDARALRTEYVPRELYHRDGTLDHLSSALAPVTRDDTPEDILIYGPSGAGKTTVAKYALEQLQAEALDVRWGYANCLSRASQASVLHALVSDAGIGADLRQEGTPRDVFIQRLRAIDGHFVAVLDEVGMLEEEKALLALQRIPNVSVVAITIEADALFTSLEQRTADWLRTVEHIPLEKYSHRELCDILAGRVEHGLREGSVADGVIDRIADLATGDARVAITLLRRAAKEAIDQEVDAITTDIVEAIQNEACQNVRAELVRTLGTHLRLLYEIVEEAGTIDATALHSAYEERAQDPKTKRQRRRYLDRLKRYELIEASGSTSQREYTVVE